MKNKSIELRPVKIDGITIAYHQEGEDGVTREYRKVVEVSHPETALDDKLHLAQETRLSGDCVPSGEDIVTYDVIPAYDFLSELIRQFKSTHTALQQEDRVSGEIPEDHWNDQLEEFADKIYEIPPEEMRDA